MYFIRTIRKKGEEKKFYLEMAVLKLSSVLGGFAEKFALKGITKFEVEPRRLLPQKLETTSTSLIHTLVYKYIYVYIAVYVIHSIYK